MGLRGRLAVLSEGYSNADFRTRMSATYNFVREVLDARGRAARADQVRWSRPPTGAGPIPWRSARCSAPPTVQAVVAEITQDGR